ncbi:MAG TPA: hypothetical protein VJ801_09055, partial [Polyangia bacterium]|nr:hypothetical protein [Polyangia bacterium]
PAQTGRRVTRHPPAPHRPHQSLSKRLPPPCDLLAGPSRAMPGDIPFISLEGPFWVANDGYPIFSDVVEPPGCRASVSGQNFGHVWAADPSRPAALLLGYIRQVCALVATCRPGGSSTET